jgi:hypothetical protein
MQTIGGRYALTHCHASPLSSEIQSPPVVDPSARISPVSSTLGIVREDLFEAIATVSPTDIHGLQWSSVLEMFGETNLRHSVPPVISLRCAPRRS